MSLRGCRRFALLGDCPRVRSDEYWRRCCEARWSFGQLGERSCGKLLPPKREGWKQFFLERVLSDFLTALRLPEMTTEEAEALDNLCLVCREYVYTLDLACQVTRFALYESPPVTHAAFGGYPFNHRREETLGQALSGKMMGFGESDALNLRRALMRYPPLRYLRLPTIG
ncbi:hypothetical protein TcBrA4_0039780 [Trypanosoma cruzi]|nr:hypothetical protein TcBrA4_0039780 [Trypanosoma cruzi]